MKSPTLDTSHRLNSSANPAHLPQIWAKWAELAVLFSWQFQNCHRDFDFFNCNYSFEVISIVHWVPQFFMHNKPILGGMGYYMISMNVFMNLELFLGTYYMTFMNVFMNSELLSGVTWFPRLFSWTQNCYMYIFHYMTSWRLWKLRLNNS